MTKLEKLLEGIQGLKTPENEKTIKKLTEGINLIADEYRNRKARESEARMAEGFARLDKFLENSGMTKKAFVESVGRQVIASKYPEGTKQKMLEGLGKWVSGVAERALKSMTTCTGYETPEKQAALLNEVAGFLADKSYDAIEAAVTGGKLGGTVHTPGGDVPFSLYFDRAAMSLDYTVPGQKPRSLTIPVGYPCSAEDVATPVYRTLMSINREEGNPVAGCIYQLVPVNARSKEYIVKNDVGGLLHDCILPKSDHKYGDAATARRMYVDKVAADNGTDIQGAHYTIARKLIDSDHEKLYVLLADDNSGAFLMHYADTPKAS